MLLNNEHQMRVLKKKSKLHHHQPNIELIIFEILSDIEQGHLTNK